MPVTANSIITPQTAISRTAILTTADIAWNAPVNIVNLLLAADNVNGFRGTRLYAIPRVAIATANNIALYEYTGTTYTLIDSALMAVITPTASVANAKTDLGYSEDAPLIVRAGYGLVAACGLSAANGIVVKLEGGLL